MFSLGVTTYVKIGLAIALLSIVFGSGWWMGYSRYLEYKKEVAVATEKQKAEVESIQKQHELVTKGIQDEYDAKLNTLRNYYKSTSVWNNNGGSTMSGISAAPKSTDVISAYNELAGSCAQTTLQLVELQKWINEQMGIE